MLPSEYNRSALFRQSAILTSISRIAHAVSSRKRIEIVARAKQLGVKVTNGKAKITSEA
jgi:ribosomal protein L32E